MFIRDQRYMHCQVREWNCSERQKKHRSTKGTMGRQKYSWGTEEASNGSTCHVAAEDGDKCFLLCDPLSFVRGTINFMKLHGECFLRRTWSTNTDRYALHCELVPNISDRIADPCLVQWRHLHLETLHSVEKHIYAFRATPAVNIDYCPQQH